MKHHRCGRRAAALLCGSVWILSLPADVSYAGESLTEAQSREEIGIAVEAILEHHPDPFHATPEPAFRREVARLSALEGAVSVEEQFFRLSRICSMTFDTHTQLHATDETDGFHTTFPLRFHGFADGLYVVAGDEHYRAAIGKRVVSIGGRSPTAVLDELSQYAPSDSRPRKRVFAEMFLYHPSTYDMLDLRTRDGRIELELAAADGTISTLQLDETWDRGMIDFSWDTLYPFVPASLLTVHETRGTDPPRYLRDLDDNYRFEFLDADRKVMYLQINRQLEQENGPSPMRFHYAWGPALLDARSEMLIVDVRNDPGGTINIADPIAGLLSYQAYEMDSLQSVVVLAGTDTVSAGAVVVAQLESAVNAVVVGEPSGSAPNMFLDPQRIVLPHSRIQLEVSRYRWVTEDARDDRRFIAPDVPVSPSFEDYLHGKDPALEAAKQVVAADGPNFYADHSLEPWKRSSQRSSRDAP